MQWNNAKISAAALGVAALAVTGLAASAASAQTDTSRSTTYFVDVSGGLDSAVTSYYNTIDIAPNVAGGVGPLNLRTGHFNEYILTTGDVTTTYTLPAAGVASENGSISSGPNGGSFQFGYQTPNARSETPGSVLRAGRTGASSYCSPATTEA